MITAWFQIADFAPIVLRMKPTQLGQSSAFVSFG